MRTLSIGKNDAGQRLDRFLLKAMPALTPGQCAKFLRTKYIKLNGKKAEGNLRISEGDTVFLYLPDKFFFTAASRDSWTVVTQPPDILYEDEHILLLNKPIGLSCHEDESENPDNLINRVKAYAAGRFWDPEKENSFAPALCNRIDRNTQGIVIAAKDAQALREMNEAIRNRLPQKEYLAIAVGEFSGEHTLRNWLIKDSSKNQVAVFPRPTPGALSAVTHITSLQVKNGNTLLLCELLTGRTHQIRAQLAYAGYPLLGDGKYGRPGIEKHQCLASYRLTFPQLPSDWEISYLSGKSFCLSRVDFVERYFPEWSLKPLL